jgi:hypothetical protein
MNPDNDNLLKWLDEKLTNSFRPHFDEIPNSKSKGIYFWFMKPDGYEKLSKYIKVKPIDSKYSKDIDGEKYDLVYLGTAGTGKKGNSHLNARFKWHVLQKHTESNVCHGTLSTLRAGLGSLLSDDLILSNTEEEVNSFMKSNMIVYYIEYKDDKLLIDSNEVSLIRKLKPVLNLKNNPNTPLQGNTTCVYKARRAFVYQNTRLRLNCKGESETSKKNIKKPTDDSPNYEHQIYSEINECIEFFVLRNQSISEVVRGIDGLPLGPCSIEIFSNDTTDVRNYINGGIRRIRASNRSVIAYFNAPDTNNGNFTKSAIIEGEMNQKGSVIEEITIRVCPIKK